MIKQLATTGGSTFVSMIIMLFGDNLVERMGEKEVRYIVVFIALFIVNYTLINGAFELWELRKKKRNLHVDLDLLDVEHLNVLRILWKKRYITPTEKQREACIFLRDVGLVARSGLREYILTPTGKDVCRKLAEYDFQHV